MGKIIGVQFQKNGKLYYFDANGFEIKTGDYVVVCAEVFIPLTDSAGVTGCWATNSDRQ